MSFITLHVNQVLELILLFRLDKTNTACRSDFSLTRRHGRCKIPIVRLVLVDDVDDDSFRSVMVDVGCRQ